MTASAQTAASTEQRILRISVILTVVIAATGVVLGLLSGSMSIVFDGLFSVIDVAMGLLALWVARLVTRAENRTFQYGYWHIEPMTLAFNGGMLMVLCVYAVVNAVGSFLGGGQDVELGWAIGYSAVMATVCFGSYFYERSANSRAKSDLLHLDAQSWLMSALAAVALLVAFVIAWGLGKTPWANLAPFVDPTILGVLSLAMIAMPIKTVRQALTEILLITPTDLDDTIREVMDRIVEKYEFTTYTSYAAKVGRGRFIEIHIVVPHARELGTVRDLDAIRDEISTALGAGESDKWLTIDFTGDSEWT
jgi:cation diffusion facilitator family transporter